MSPDRFHALLQSFSERRIAVLGDFLLDEYIIGATSRVSREAPIVVVDYQETVHHPGGASNAAQNVTAVGAHAVALGVRGGDREGEALCGLLASKGVDTGALVAERDYATPLKLRIMAGEMNAQKQQVARVDRSARLHPTPSLLERLGEAVREAVDSCDAVLISDYGIGLVPGALSKAAIEWSSERGIPVIVDSRFALGGYARASVATPNEVEANAIALGKTESLSRSLREACGIDRFVVTRGSKGMLVCDGDKETTIGIVGGNDATDVTGAGDTVSAVVALSLASGASLVEAAKMATYAASIVVMKRGTATASVSEIAAVIDRHPVF